MAQLTRTQIDQFNRDGLSHEAQLFDAEEMDLLITIAKNDQRLEREALERRDAQCWNQQIMVDGRVGRRHL